MTWVLLFWAMAWAVNGRAIRSLFAGMGFLVVCGLLALLMLLGVLVLIGGPAGSSPEDDITGLIILGMGFFVGLAIAFPRIVLGTGVIAGLSTLVRGGLSRWRRRGRP